MLRTRNPQNAENVFYFVGPAPLQQTICFNIELGGPGGTLTSEFMLDVFYFVNTGTPNIVLLIVAGLQQLVVVWVTDSVWVPVWFSIWD